MVYCVRKEGIEEGKRVVDFLEVHFSDVVREKGVLFANRYTKYAEFRISNGAWVNCTNETIIQCLEVVQIYDELALSNLLVGTQIKG